MNRRKLLSDAAAVAKKTGSILMTLVILLAALLTGLYLFKIRPYIVKTGSMEPAIHTGSVVFVNERAELSGIKVGDVITFRKGGEMLVTHRVVKVGDGEYTTKGDANSVNDPEPVTRENYIGKTVTVLPGLGGLFTFLKSTAGRISVGCLIGALLLLSFIPQRKKNESKEAEDNGQEKA